MNQLPSISGVSLWHICFIAIAVDVVLSTSGTCMNSPPTTIIVCINGVISCHRTRCSCVYVYVSACGEIIPVGIVSLCLVVSLDIGSVAARIALLVNNIGIGAVAVCV